MAHGVPEKYIKGGVIVGFVEEKPPAEKPAEQPAKQPKKKKGAG